jgi:hypothetical protein
VVCNDLPNLFLEGGVMGNLNLSDYYEQMVGLLFKSLIDHPMKVELPSKKYPALSFKVKGFSKTGRSFNVEIAHGNVHLNDSFVQCAFLQTAEVPSLCVEAAPKFRSGGVSGNQCDRYNSLLRTEIKCGNVGKYEVADNGQLVFRSTMCIEGSDRDEMVTDLSQTLFLIFALGELPSYF